MDTSNYIYHDGSQELHGFLAYEAKTDSPRPAVLVVHDWTGRNEFACEKARLLAKMGYVGFAVDMYGQGKLGTNDDEKNALMEPLVADRTLVRKRMRAALDTVLGLSEVDTTRIAVIGFCFGGLCALELARSGADIKGVASFHGLLMKQDALPSEKIKAKILVLHGYDDSMVPPKQVNAFCQEMTDAKVDWQVHMYGHTQHGFTNPKANDLKSGILYNEVAACRSWLAMTDFFNEIFLA